jgi:hypothetical protein
MSRYILFVMHNAQSDIDAQMQAGPDPKVVAKMTRFNEELAKSGALKDANGLAPPSMGARVTFPGGDKVKVTDGPFTEAKELVGGYWILECASRDEAVEWARKAPMPEGSIIEVRKIMDMEDHKPAVQKAAKSDIVRDAIEQAEKNQRG